MKKKAFIAMSLLDIISWIIFILAIIGFYFIFKISAQQSSLTIYSSPSKTSFYPVRYLLDSPADDMAISELILNSHDLDNYATLQSLLDSRYTKEGFYWSIQVCDSEEFMKFRKNKRCFYKESSSRSGLDISPIFEKHSVLQLPNIEKETFVKFIYSPAKEDLLMYGGLP